MFTSSSEESGLTNFKTIESPETLIEVALELMKTERAAIVSGDFDRIYNLTEEKFELLEAIEKQFSDLATEAQSEDFLARRSRLHDLALALSRDAEANQKLLRAAQDGVEKARHDVLGTTFNPEASFYAPGGSRITISHAVSEIVRKI